MPRLCTCKTCGTVHINPIDEEYKQFLNGYQHGRLDIPPANETYSYQRGYTNAIAERQRAEDAKAFKAAPIRQTLWNELEQLEAEPWEGK